MGFWQIVLYLSDLIHAGHKWQRQNIIGTNSERAFKLSVFQIMGCLLAGWFVYKNPSGVSDTAIDYLLSKHPTPILAVWTISATFAPC